MICLISISSPNKRTIVHVKKWPKRTLIHWQVNIWRFYYIFPIHKDRHLRKAVDGAGEMAHPLKLLNTRVPFPHPHLEGDMGLLTPVQKEQIPLLYTLALAHIYAYIYRAHINKISFKVLIKKLNIFSYTQFTTILFLFIFYLCVYK